MNPHPARVPFVDLHLQYSTIQQEIDNAIESVIRDSAFIRGRHVEGFESKWAELIGTPHCVSCANGTDALYIAMRGLGVKPGDEVITTAHSWISTSETITQAGGRVVFCDTNDRFLIDPEQIESKITPRTVGILPVHLYGQAADMDAILRVAKKHHLWVLEDCAQAHLCRYRGRPVGTFGNAATFSFYPGKNLGAFGDAGCVITRDAALADWMTKFARHGGKGNHVMEGINSRLDGLQAAIINVKMPHLERWNEMRRAAATRYTKLLAQVPGVQLPGESPDCQAVHHLYVIRTAQRDGLRQHLRSRNIDTVINYPKALPFYPAYDYLGHQPEDFPVAHRHQSSILSLPMFPELSEEQISRVVAAVREWQAGTA